MNAREAIALLERTLNGELSLTSCVSQLHDAVLQDDSSGSIEEVLRELAYDLEYYEPDAKRREQDPSYFGSERALREVRDAVTRLREMV